ncbi:Obscurin [Chionoecetes opilio]|uniref:Obscurin n=1 Tax=Chionoecetes opilio TaxID=41210 RepID=A0A8J4Y7W2_CHIOP|nr:Obscurin [Chionoecetes opilio]
MIANPITTSTPPPPQLPAGAGHVPPAAQGLALRSTFSAFAMAFATKTTTMRRSLIVHERRRFTDVMDEEIDDDRRKRRMIDRKTISFIRGRMETCALDMPRPSKYETTTHLALTERVREVEEGSTSNTAPFLREKPQTTAITIGSKLDLTVVASGVPEPGVQWFRNDAPLSTDAQRLTITTTASRSTLTIDPSKDLDAGLYKVVARNDAGQVTHKFRLLQGHVPGPCDTPEVPQIGESEMFVKWKSPIEDGGARVLCYRLEMKQSGDIKWTSVAENIDHEFFRLSNLTHDTTYFFRVSAKNSMGWGDCSPATAPTKTHATGVTGSHKVEVPQHMLQLQKQTESGKTLPQCPERRDIDYSKELEPVKLKTGENAELQVRKYSPVVEVSRGRFGNVAKCVRTDDHRHFVLKVLQTKGRESQVTHEYEMHSSLRHERIVQLYEAYSGLDILTYLASLYQYSEQQVYTVTSQVLDALSYLHWRGYCHLDLQPDNIVVTSSRKCDVKLVDFGSAQKVAKLGSDITLSGHLDYTAPEVLLEHKAHLTSDVWSLGALVFALLAGRSAFGGVDEEDTKANIQYVKFKGDHLNPGVSQEAIRFLMLIFKRDP